MSAVSCFSRATTLSVSAGSSAVDGADSSGAAGILVAAVSGGSEWVLAVPSSGRDDLAFVGLTGGGWMAATGLVDTLPATLLALLAEDGAAAAAGFDRADFAGRDGTDVAPEVLVVFTAPAEGDVACAASYAWTTLAGRRPRSLVVKPF